MATGSESTPTEYIVHHLTHNATGAQKFIVDFSVFNIDTIVFSIACLLLTLFVLRTAARRATPGVPGRFQAFTEIIVEFVEEQSKAIVQGDRTFIAPLALTVFIWIFLMNAIDLIPVDFLPWLGHTALPWLTGGAVHIEYLRPLPTADINGTIGLSFGVLLLMLYYGIKIKGVGGFMHELFTAPFGANPLLWPFNFLLNVIEFVAKGVSLGMRLFGNMYAGELLFFIIALLGGYAALSGSGILMVIGQVVAGLAWWLFHVLIITLQAFIFMMLTLVYIGQAHEGH